MACCGDAAVKTMPDNQTAKLMPPGLASSSEPEAKKQVADPHGLFRLAAPDNFGMSELLPGPSADGRYEILGSDMQVRGTRTVLRVGVGCVLTDWRASARVRGRVFRS